MFYRTATLPPPHKDIVSSTSTLQGNMPVEWTWNVLCVWIVPKSLQRYGGPVLAASQVCPVGQMQPHGMQSSPPLVATALPHWRRLVAHMAHIACMHCLTDVAAAGAG